MLSDVLLFVAVGFAAQLVDGAIGMAYGLTSTTVLLSLGVPPATASASVHAAEVFTTGASALSHWRLGNVDAALFRRLALPGILGGAAGAYLLTEIPGDAVQPLVSVYLGIMGGLVLWKALRSRPARETPPRYVGALGLAGGFLDAIGGGGWGPLVASTLAGAGTKARFVIGSTNAAEFLVTATISATFVLTIGLDLWPIILGLVIGGVLAAPFAALAARKMPDRPLMILVGVVIIILSLRGIVQSFIL
ncbi:sulfite exporter TauE/SafE family protein [Microvirga sp. GCM10011540]|uniref:sulfite exporter TauE/SafE family protein n=1 Tax=Microvirga sp. GCM10011540 TaxID=3317338 RepID=UPI0036120025